ncbi:hypothetical protein [Microcoleus sp. EPA2]|uniref:hypothetical protein n=1 Tax=Microcoleus sp. EPA2 TaxID=2841654 RepID=UPI00312BA578
MIQAQNKLEIQKEYVALLLEQLTIADRDSSQERKAIAKQYPGSEQEFALLEELELLTVNIRGYASIIKLTGGVENVRDAIQQLSQLSVFNVPIVARFYVEQRSPYPQTKMYLQLLDYLRLLVLEYLQVQGNIQPILA